MRDLSTVAHASALLADASCYNNMKVVLLNCKKSNTIMETLTNGICKSTCIALQQRPCRFRDLSDQVLTPTLTCLKKERTEFTIAPRSLKEK